MILDGRNRHLACQMAGVEPHFEQFARGKGAPGWDTFGNEAE
jgi:N6-adenosine-specific RNA methylase IME4